MEDLVKKVEGWVNSGVISIKTARNILAAEGIDAETALQIHSGNKLVRVISILGSILVALGVMLFLGKNWQIIPISIKLLIICTSTIAAYGAGYYVTFVRSDYKKMGSALFLLGAILYGAGIFLVAQMFHTNANPSTLFLLWTLGILPFAVFFKEELVFVLAAFVSMFWSGFVVFYENIFFVFDSTRMPQTPHYWYLVVFVPMLALTIMRDMKIGFASMIAMFYIWFGISLGMLSTNDDSLLGAICLFYLILGFIFILTARVVGEWRQNTLTPILYFFGAAASAVALYLLSWNEILYSIGKNLNFSGAPWFWFVTLLVLLAGLFLAYFVKGASSEHKTLLMREGGILLLISVYTIVYWMFPAEVSRSYYYGWSGEFHPYVLPWNVALLAFNVLLIIVGYFERKGWYINIGILFFLLHVMSRYFDVFALKLGTSFSFIIGGLLLLGLAVGLERYRRTLITNMKSTLISSAS
jgi:uncharacterized membrane protein